MLDKPFPKIPAKHCPKCGSDVLLWNDHICPWGGWLREVISRNEQQITYFRKEERIWRDALAERTDKEERLSAQIIQLGGKPCK